MKLIKEGTCERIWDLSLAAYLSVHFPIETIDRDPRYAPRVLFLFQKSEGLTAAINAFHSGNASVEPTVYFAKIRFLKSRIFNPGTDKTEK